MLKKFIKYFIWRLHLYKNKYKKDKWYFVLKYGIGDTYMIFMILSQMKDFEGSIEIILAKESHKFIPSLFNSKCTIKVKNNMPYNMIKEFSSYKKGVPIILHPIDIYDSKFVNMIGLNGVTLIDVYKLILGHALKITLPIPEEYVKYDKSIEEIMIKNKFKKGKTVLLCPEANSIEQIEEDFWLKLYKKLNDKELSPVFLNYKPKLSGYNTISFPLEYSIQICNEMGYVVALRSGFCDLISTSKAIKVILYNQGKYYSGSLMESTSLVKMYNIPKQYNHELEISQDYTLTLNKINDLIV